MAFIDNPEGKAHVEVLPPCGAVCRLRDGGIIHPGSVKDVMNEIRTDIVRETIVGLAHKRVFNRLQRPGLSVVRVRRGMRFGGGHCGLE